VHTSLRTSALLSRSAAALRLLALAAVLSCGGDSQPTELVLGTGEAGFEPAADGDTLTLYAGTQGGHHVWLSMRMRGFEPESVRMILDVIPELPAPPARTEIPLHFTARSGEIDDGLPFEFTGWPARVLAPECAVDAPVLLRVQLLDARGHDLTRELRVVAGPPRLPFSSECAL
jgi:hypothetical protein